jgi:glutamate formiminotransferase/formiminotetrahydrofolate cyclodeaminase
MKQLIECVPNFSEGCDMHIIEQITAAISSVEGIRLLNTDPGKATNRTVVTFVGEPGPVLEAAFSGIKTAAQLIDMSKHRGAHPRMGATDVCPLIPVANITLEETVQWARKLGERVGNELGIPVYLYEAAQSDVSRSNLAVIRAGEYEGFFKKIKDPQWKPDFGPSELPAKTGATVIGARDFLIAYNVNLNTRSVKRANSVAFDVREAGRVVRSGNPVSGPVMKDEKGEEVRMPGKLKGVKAIGWFIEEYGIAQVSINITRFRETPLHVVFEECAKSASERGMRVTGSELVGLVPLSAMLEAGRYFLKKQRLSAGVSDHELIHIAVKSMGLDELAPFRPDERIIEYAMRQPGSDPLVSKTLEGFSAETASESPAPGGGSVSAYVGALGISLGTMVGNLSASKKGWEDRWESFGEWAEKGQAIRKELMLLVDEDTRSFQAIMAAFQLPKNTDQEKADRKKAVQEATKYAMEVPFRVMELSCKAMEIIREMAFTGNPNSVSDAAVGMLCARTAVAGAFLNVRINASGYDDQAFTGRLIAEGSELHGKAMAMEQEVLSHVEKTLS